MNISKTVVRNFKVLFEGVLAVGGILYMQQLGQVRVVDLAGDAGRVVKVVAAANQTVYDIAGGSAELVRS